MNNNLNQYQEYATADLLKITMRPEAYEEDALIAATEILKTRVVTQADIKEAEDNLRENTPTAPKKKPLANIFNVNSYTHDTWLNVILAIVILEYIHLFYIDFKFITVVFGGQDYAYRQVGVLSYLDLFFLPFVYFMFYKRMRWGWITLLGVKLITMAASLVFYFNEYWPVEHGAGLLTYSLLTIFLDIPILIFLWRQDVSSIFKVDNKTRRIALSAMVLFIVMLFVIGDYNHANYAAIRSSTTSQTETAGKQADTTTGPQPSLLGLINATRKKEVDTAYMPTGFYFVAEKGKGIKMRVEQSDTIYTLAPLPFASVKNVMRVRFEKAQYKKVEYTNLCMTFDNAGTEALANGTGNPLHPKIAAVVANRLLYVVENKTPITNGSTCVALLGYTEKEIEEMRNAIDKKR
ncbi:hypothetical protein [Mucilaginibacter flavus]|uniref:hypothetical protein n=1 Tax=Mucilaginibacter flavus TaxID=931504 RepID=UPI0025B61CDC|nr:hypothetical protein [Mucilaginibacter flavus]MDN3581754.1 hypothetical protein [Mucilaginibacter flavus]